MRDVAGLSERELARVRGRLVEFSEEMFDEGLEQKYDGQVLHALALTLQRKPWPIWFVAQNDLGFGK